jgi:hypothetical protein
MPAEKKRFAVILILYLVWLGALGAIGVWSGKAPEAKVHSIDAETP